MKNKLAISKKYGVTSAFVSHISNHKRRTLNIRLAKDIAKLTGDDWRTYVPERLLRYLSLK